MPRLPLFPKLAPRLTLSSLWRLLRTWGRPLRWLWWLWPRLWLLLGQVRRVQIQSRTDEDEVPTFLTTTCLMFSTSEKNQNVQNKTSSFFKRTAFKHLYILDFGIFACIPVTTFRTSRENEKCVVLASDFIQRLRIKCRCLTTQSFNIKENIILAIFEVSMHKSCY